MQRQPHLHDRASQEAAWQAVVKVSGVNLSPAKRASPSGPSIKKRPVDAENSLPSAVRESGVLKERPIAA